MQDLVLVLQHMLATVLSRTLSQQQGQQRKLAAVISVVMCVRVSVYADTKVGNSIWTRAD